MELLDVLAAFMAVIALLLMVKGLSRRPSLSEPLKPYQPSVADQAESWLKSRE